MSLPYGLPYRLWIMNSQVVQGIALNPGVRLVKPKASIKQVYTRHGGTDFERFCCKKAEASKRLSEDLTGEREPGVPPGHYNAFSRMKRDPAKQKHPSAERGIGVGETWWTLFGSRVYGSGFSIWGLGFRV